jgi:hypothetical protein
MSSNIKNLGFMYRTLGQDESLSLSSENNKKLYRKVDKLAKNFIFNKVYDSTKANMLIFTYKMSTVNLYFRQRCDFYCDFFGKTCPEHYKII